MAYKPIGKKSSILAYKKRRSIRRRNMNRAIKSSLFRGKGELALGQKQQHYATLTETVLLNDLEVNTTYLECFQLNQFPRALAVSTNYKWYRAKVCYYKYEPLYNMYADTAGADSMPYLYTLMNRTQDDSQYDANQLRAQGCIPIVFNKTKTIKYKPNWCQQGLGAYSQQPGQPITSINGQGLTKCYDWLECPKAFANGPLDTTQPIITNAQTAAGVVPMQNYTSTVIYNGHLAYFEQGFSGGGSNYIARGTVTVVWEFKGPKVDVGVVPGSSALAFAPRKVIKHNKEEVVNL